jgi:hypothetical protein
VSKTQTTNQNKNRSDSSTTRMSSSSSIQRRGNSRGNGTRQVPMLTTANRGNLSNQTRSSSDISEDEAMDLQTNPHSVPRRASAVHEYATKLSSTEYQCKLCPKVKISFSLIGQFLGNNVFCRRQRLPCNHRA